MRHEGGHAADRTAKPPQLLSGACRRRPETARSRRENEAKNWSLRNRTRSNGTGTTCQSKKKKRKKSFFFFLFSPPATAARGCFEMRPTIAIDLSAGSQSTQRRRSPREACVTTHKKTDKKIFFFFSSLLTDHTAACNQMRLITAHPQQNQSQHAKSSFAEKRGAKSSDATSKT